MSIFKHVLLPIFTSTLLLAACAPSEEAAPPANQEEEASFPSERNLKETEMELIEEQNIRIEKLVDAIVIPEVLDQQETDQYVVSSEFDMKQDYSVSYYINNDELQLSYLITDGATSGTNLKDNEEFYQVEHSINYDVFTNGEMYYLVAHENDVYISFESLDYERTTYEELSAMLDQLVPHSETFEELLNKTRGDFLAPSYRLGDPTLIEIASLATVYRGELSDSSTSLLFEAFGVFISEEGNNPNETESMLVSRDLVEETHEGETLYFVPRDSMYPAVYREVGDYIYRVPLHEYGVDEELYHNMDKHYDELVKIVLSLGN
ncbi:hypothetical protein [Alkalihalophilus marmarensis]|uniref:DUF4367 domain-containing protein n=1 Tax=Alkalihalophilus marmarensis DSM 21297 TaxID=1188261 RepID=U6SJI8_9BACI|nr:hypothetical protein [Alkalihalophilus marmarensis]ERN51854.1 hypothetical protein A33I_18760 [Alkalihalophilus marmarensis DSM 21297]